MLWTAMPRSRRVRIFYLLLATLLHEW
jgi:hypothetical protein